MKQYSSEKTPFSKIRNRSFNNKEYNDQEEEEAQWTLPKLFLICLLGCTAFYATNNIDWSNDKLSLNNLIARPELNDHHYNNILSKEFSAHLQKRSQRHVELMGEPEKIHKLHESNVGMGFNMYEPTEAVESHEHDIHKLAVDHINDPDVFPNRNKRSLEEEEKEMSKSQMYYFEDYLHIPLYSLEQIRISQGHVSVSLYTQGTEDIPTDYISESNGKHLLERNFMITEGSDGEHLSFNVPSSDTLDLIKKSGVVRGSYEVTDDSTYDNNPVNYYNRDGSEHLQFLDLLAQSGANGAYSELEKIIDDLEITTINQEDFPNRNPNARNKKAKVRYVASTLPCLNKKKDETDALFMARSFSFMQEMETENKGGQGFGGNSNSNREKNQNNGPPVGCCNGRPYSAKKRCCCRRKSYDTESEFCCISANGCAAFQTFKNNTENRNACMQIGGTILKHEYFDYQATPMIGWAAGKPYGPAGIKNPTAYSATQFNSRVENELKERYNDANGLNSQTVGSSRTAVRDYGTGRGTYKKPESFEEFKGIEMEQMINESVDNKLSRNLKYSRPNARDAYWKNQLTSRDFIEDLRVGANNYPLRRGK